MLYMFWRRKISSNNEFFKLTEKEDTGIVLVKQRWRWIGHMLCRTITTISKVALRWTPGRNIREAAPNTPRGGLQRQVLNLKLGVLCTACRPRTERDGGVLLMPHAQLASKRCIMMNRMKARELHLTFSNITRSVKHSHENSNN